MAVTFITRTCSSPSSTILRVSTSSYIFANVGWRIYEVVRFGLGGLLRLNNPCSHHSELLVLRNIVELNRFLAGHSFVRGLNGPKGLAGLAEITHTPTEHGANTTSVPVGLTDTV